MHISDKSELAALFKDPGSATFQLMQAWSDTPLLLMLDIDWERGPLVLIGREDLMMWPLLPPGTLLQLDKKRRMVVSGRWSEFERPVYLIEYRGRFYCCHAQRKGEKLILISHAESPARPTISAPLKEAKVRGQLLPLLRPLATRGSSSGRRWY